MNKENLIVKAPNCYGKITGTTEPEEVETGMMPYVVAMWVWFAVYFVVLFLNN
jgi:hypothetical protein